MASPFKTYSEGGTFSLLVLDKNFLAIYPISKFNAFIWTIKYWECGDFQLEVPWDPKPWQYLKVGYYLYLRGQDEIMIIERIGLTYDAADKSKRKIVVKGRTPSSLLTRRIVWGAWGSETATNLQTMLLNLVDGALVNPSDYKRKIPFFRTKTNSGVAGLSVAASGYGDNLYSLVNMVCETYEIGFRSNYVDEEGLVYFELFKGNDRSYSQTTFPPVIFSSSFENLGPTRYALDVTEYKTIALASGREEEGDKTTVVVGSTGLSGLNRYEMYVSTNEVDPNLIAEAAMQKLAKVNALTTLDAELDASRQFIFGRDFYIGDVVQIVTDFGLDAKARVTEFTMCWDETGYTEVPVFKVLEE